MFLKIKIFEFALRDKHKKFDEDTIAEMFNIFENLDAFEARDIFIKLVDIALLEYCSGNQEKGIEFFDIIYKMGEKVNIIIFPNTTMYFGYRTTTYKKFITNEYSEEDRLKYRNFMLFLYSRGLKPHKHYVKFVPSEVRIFNEL